MSPRRLWLLLQLIVPVILTAATEPGQESASSSAPTAMLVAPFDIHQAKAAQSDRAQHLNRRVLEENSIGMELRLIPPGSFLMGSSEGGKELGFTPEKRYWAEGEHPIHQVRITKPFYVGVCEVTKRQFRQFVDATRYTTGAEQDPEGGWGWLGIDGFLIDQDPNYTWQHWGLEQSGDAPVVNVSWRDAVAFCEWLTRQEGRRYRLPTEAEWEYACRAGTTTRYHTGDAAEQLVRTGNVRDAAALKQCRFWEEAVTATDNQPFLCPVKQYEGNAFGLHDMHGNAAEWCSDWYAADAYAKSPADDPTGPASGKYHVIRGGAWDAPACYCRSASRFYMSPACRCNVGFRVVLVP
jgi:formylglycine-generating enzyme required for sulfatase activity